MKALIFTRPIVRIIIEQPVYGRPVRWRAWVNDHAMSGVGATEDEAIGDAVRQAAACSELADAEPSLGARIVVAAAYILAGVAVAALIVWTLLGYPSIF